MKKEKGGKVKDKEKIMQVTVNIVNWNMWEYRINVIGVRETH